MSVVMIVLSALLFAAAVYLLLTVFVHAVRQSGEVAEQRKRRAKLTRVYAWLRPRLSTRLDKKLERQITMAGGLDGMTPPGVVLLSMALGASAFLVASFIASAGFPVGIVLLFPVLAAWLPFAWLNDRVKARHNAMLRQMPFQLDLLTLGVEAGLDFTAALAKTIEKSKPGPLREEFAFMQSQIRVGTPRAQAMRELQERAGLPPLSAVLSALIQADRLGVPVGKVLRVQSESVRTERSQRAEKRANEAPVKILLPLVIFIFPTIWLILFGPLVFDALF